MNVAHLVVGRDDRAAIIPMGDAHALVVADGAGGTGSGHLAAEAIIEHVRACVAANPDFDPVRVLTDGDRDMSGAETTCVLAVVNARGVYGASVGDTEALVFGARDVVLTRHQLRKPLLGSCAARPIPFAAPRVDTLLIATDGLTKYAKPTAIRTVATSADLSTIPARLIELVRLPSGDLHDDVAVIVCRNT